MKPFFYIFFCFLVCSSCMVNISDQFAEGNPPKLVLSAELVAGESPLINVTRTTGCTELDSLYFIDNCDIYFQDNDEVIHLFSVGNGNYVRGDFVLEAGKEYYILCSCEGFEDASVVIHVPEFNIPDLTLEVDDNYDIQFAMVMRDDADYFNLYSMYFKSWRRYYSKSYTTYWVDSVEYDTVVYDTGYSYQHISYLLEEDLVEYVGDSYDFREPVATSYSRVFIPDNSFQGEVQSFHFTIPLIKTYNDTVPELTFHLDKRDEPFYRFGRSVMNYEPDPDIPILELVHVYTNIENGFGLVTCRTEYDTTYDMSSYYSDPDFLVYRDSVLEARESR